MTQSLHYIWINATKAPVPAVKEMAYCPVPEHYLYNLADVRTNYPEVDITLWCDFYGAAQCPTDIWEATMEEAMVPGVKFRALRSLPAYRHDPLFDIAGDCTDYMYGAIWQQVDLARLLVLTTVLEVQGTGNGFYNDMDLTDPRMEDPKAQEILEKYGMLFLQHPSLTGKQKGYLENSFMAFSHARLSWIRDVLIPRTQDYIMQNETGWEALKAVLAEEFPDADPEVMDHLVIKSDHLEIAHPAHSDFANRNQARTAPYNVRG